MVSPVPNDVLIGISTFRKNQALRELLKSAQDNGYLDANDILITDDEAPGALEVFQEFVHPNLLYIGGQNLGIAKNKNRSLRYFLHHPQYKQVILLDDDLRFSRNGLVEALKATELPHVTGYLGSWVEGLGPDPDERKQFSGNSFFDDFPIQGLSKNRDCFYIHGSQGIMMYMTREIVEKAQYFHIPPGKYGYEHSIYSNVINRCMGFHVDWFPVLIDTPKYIVGNFNHPNNYVADPQTNSKWWQEKKAQIQKGINFVNKVSGVPAGEEVLRHDIT